MSSPSSKTDVKSHGRTTARLFWRIWWLLVAVTVLGIAVVSALWRLDVEHDRSTRPGAEIVVRDLAGHEIGYAQAVRQPRFGPPTQFQVVTEDGETLWIELPPPRPTLQNGWAHYMGVWGSLGWGGTVALVGLVFVVVSLPLVRGLTRRLEGLQQGVRRWGDGDLAARLPVQGDDEVAELARHFNAAAERVEALVASHKHLLAHASHELRSPLARIRMGLALLDDSAEAAVVKAEIARNVAELDQLVDEVLLASRLEHNPESAALDEWVDLVGLAAEECVRVDAQLEVQQAVVVRGSSVLLRRMLRNLLENAQRHGASQACSEIQVELGLENGHALIRVADRGPGVPEEWREKVFEPFVRMPGAHEKHGSVGLGLALVRMIAQRHGAEVSVHARDGGGSIFQVVFKI